MDQTALEKLKTRMDADDPQALFEYAEFVRETDPEACYKYTILSAQLGYPPAIQRVGDMYYNAGDIRTAKRFYKSGAKAGLLDCSVKLAVMELGGVGESVAIHDLEELAEIGVKSACCALSNYYKTKGKKREAVYWGSLAK